MWIIVVLAAQYHCYVDGVQHGSAGGLQGRTSGRRGRESRRELGLHLYRQKGDINLAITIVISCTLL